MQRDDKHHQSLVIPKVLDFFHLLNHSRKRGATWVFSTQPAITYQGIRNSSFISPTEQTLLSYFKSNSYSLYPIGKISSCPLNVLSNPPTSEEDGSFSSCVIGVAPWGVWNPKPLEISLLAEVISSQNENTLYIYQGIINIFKSFSVNWWIIENQRKCPLRESKRRTSGLVFNLSCTLEFPPD